MAGKTKKPIALTAVVAVLLVLGIVLNVAAYGFLSDVLTMRFGSAAVEAEMTEEEKAEIRTGAKKVALSIERDGIVLLNNNGTLPMSSSGKKVDILGYYAKNTYYGGSGSGALSDTSTPISFAQAFKDAGWTVNEAILNSYGEGLSTSFEIQDPNPDTYWDKTDAAADLALVVLGRAGGEGSDLPTSGYGADGKAHYMELSDNERALIAKAAAQYKNLIIIINSANTLELGLLDELYSKETGTNGNIDAVLWIGKPGYHGLPALVEIIEGKLNPSGRLSDTYAFDAFSAPAVKAYGDNIYTGLKVTGGAEDGFAHYQEYSEGIFVGYRYFETAAELGYIDYYETVQYPFGFGLSYTDFTWEVESAEIPSTIKGDGEFSVRVKVTNTGSVPGKDVVELYTAFDADQLRNFKLDHSAANLIAFAKTSELPAGGSEVVELNFSAEDIASYDDKGVYSASGSYVIESGKYTLALRTDSHTDKNSAINILFNVDTAVVYSNEARPSDVKAVSNVFGSADNSILNGSAYDIDVKYLSVSDDAEAWTGNLAHKGELAPTASLTAFIADGANVSITNKGYEVHTATVKVGAETGLDINNFTETDYSSDEWTKLVQQMSVSEMSKLIIGGGYKTDKVSSVNKEKTIDSDGPCGIYYFSNPSQYPGTAYPSPIVLAATWNTQLAEDFGESIAKEASIYGIVGWYAPGANIHRTPFSGRNFEYYSEDPVLTGFMAANVCSASTEGGLIPYLKHFVLNDSEIHRNGNVLHWCTEQALREIYLKAFEYPVKASAKLGLTSTTGIMSAFNYIGDRWCGASYELLTTILRGEWGFEGTVITDYFGGYGYMDADCAIRAGNDLMLNTVTATLSKSSEDDKYYMQQASKNILFAYSRSAQSAKPAEAPAEMEPWQVFGMYANIVWWLITAALAVFCVIKWTRYIKTKKEVRQ